MRKGKGGKEGEMMMKEQIHPLISSCVLVRFFFCLFVLFCFVVVFFATNRNVARVPSECTQL